MLWGLSFSGPGQIVMIENYCVHMRLIIISQVYQGVLQDNVRVSVCVLLLKISLSWVAAGQ